MKAFASALIATGVLVTVGLSVPAQAAETSAPAQVTVEAPASAVVSFDRVEVATVAAPARKAPVEVTVPVEVPAVVTVPVDVVEVPVPVMSGGVNPECAEQWMQTSADGSCLPTECPVAGQTMTVEGNCVAARVEPARVEPVRPVKTAPVAKAPAKDSTAVTAPKCGELKLGEAWAGVGTHCNLGK